ncbi:MULTISPECIES: phasin family protein [unclassified Rhizobium]|uniref:phasin family protein n=1 Tax=unclassified Rhizobium TaxID=2613769 RepID=UPI0015FFEB9E|nr:MULTISPECIES: phasin family protein [unclassified Rhizobium]MBB1247614.1 phasin family protein [Rhizobium sp. G21]MCV3764115.1 phasin family protein [Rhizobium sp. TRM95796]
MFKFDDANMFGKDAMDKMLKSYSTTAKGFQAIASETSEYSKKSFESAVAHMQALMGVKSFEAAIELQTNFTKSALEGYVSEMTKLSEMYADLAKDAYKPVENVVPAAAEIVKTKAEKMTSAAASAAA